MPGSYWFFKHCKGDSYVLNQDKPLSTTDCGPQTNQQAENQEITAILYNLIKEKLSFKSLYRLYIEYCSKHVVNNSSNNNNMSATIVTVNGPKSTSHLHL